MCTPICLRYKLLPYVPAGMALATLFVTMPFVVRELIPILETMDLSEEEAARTMGASDWQVFWNVTLPNIRYGLLYGIVLTNAVCSTIRPMLCWRFGIFPTLLTCHSCWSATPTFSSLPIASSSAKCARPLNMHTLATVMVLQLMLLSAGLWLSLRCILM